MADVDFSDFDQAVAWFEKQTPERRCVMSSRAALRVVATIDLFDGDGKEKLALAVFRAILTSAGRGLGRPADVEALTEAADSARAAARAAARSVAFSADPADSARAAARSVAFSADSADSARAAADSAFSAADSAFSAARSAADPAADPAFSAAFSAARSAADPAFSAAFWDSHQDDDVLRQSALWQDAPESILKAHTAWITYLENEPDWAFWLRWYSQMWDGTFRDWDLAIEVAKIPDDVWKGDHALAKVAEAIRGIETQLKTRVSPQLFRKADGKFDLESDVQIDDEPISFAIGQVEIALRGALAGDRNNGFTQDADEAVLIQMACTEYREQHSNVATAFWNACMGLQHNIGDIYPEDRTLISLQNTLYVSVEEMCKHSELIRDRIARLAALETRRYPTQEEREALRQLPGVIAEDTTERANAEIAAVVDHVVDTEKPARVWRAKLVNWINTLGRGIEQGQKTEKKVNWLLGLGRKISGWFFDEDGPGDTLE